MTVIDLPPRIADAIERAWELAAEHLQRPLTDEETALIVAAVFRHFDEPDAPTTRLQ
ncbi:MULTISPECIES: hypothetical protein [Rhizobium]|uniref:hypothetical protein n=1 Tax=Rhizobium TaxID=379 RepID=UPI0007F06035|nr:MULTISPECIES: hypothetical protein [Rhizobium]ANK91568.1 hypothetical protein AMK01_CH02109 [Rhizobium sp. N6212]ANK97601.1 hypothetical protein AMK00_CH02111 [Rhizobium sp. N621]ANL03681.1 hypothetical protein AMJ99_CH02139 [Rhizobium esperanzae]ANL09727.1 hypothetical protein AMJ98_CH02061 [Rhizobium sp. N1341]ANL21778.1 hypothetical protein AMJ96_CH02067 [Rhizobium sp. N113]